MHWSILRALGARDPDSNSGSPIRLLPPLSRATVGARRELGGSWGVGIGTGGFIGQCAGLKVGGRRRMAGDGDTLTDEKSSRDPPPIRSARLHCEVCGKESPHRILAARTGRRGGVEGVARCSECRTTHRFARAPITRAELPVVISQGKHSRPARVRLPSGRRLLVGSRLPGVPGALRITRIDRGNRTTREARASGGVRVWVVPDRGARVAVSLVDRGRTRSSVVYLAPETPLTVGGWVSFAGVPGRVVRLRTRDRTETRAGERIPAREVVRVYARRIWNPPAGSSGWRTERGTPSSRANAAS